MEWDKGEGQEIGLATAVHEQGNVALRCRRDSKVKRRKKIRRCNPKDLAEQKLVTNGRARNHQWLHTFKEERVSERIEEGTDGEKPE